MFPDIFCCVNAWDFSLKYSEMSSLMKLKRYQYGTRSFSMFRRKAIWYIEYIERLWEPFKIIRVI